MTINKSFGFLAQIHGIQQYTKVMLGCLAASTVLLLLVVRQLGKTAVGKSLLQKASLPMNNQTNFAAATPTNPSIH
jgi:hypothetical protein